MNDLISERQQYWLDHLKAADAFDGTIADYARSQGFKPKVLYQWKGLLARRGLLETQPTEPGGFVEVIAPERPSGMALILPNGARLEWQGDVSSEQVAALVLAAGQLA